LTLDKEFITTLIAIAGATAAIMSKSASKADLKELKTELTGKIDGQGTSLIARIDKLEARMDNGFNTMNGHLMHIVEASGTHDGRITALEKRVR
jgi:hypothetical protein